MSYLLLSNYFLFKGDVNEDVLDFVHKKGPLVVYAKQKGAVCKIEFL